MSDVPDPALAYYPVRRAVEAAVAAEREACAALAESMPPCCMLHDAHEDIAAAIRARGAAAA